MHKISIFLLFPFLIFSLDVDSIRSLFPYLQEKEPLIYFDSAATTQKPQSVIDSIKKFYEKEYATVHRGYYRSSIKATEKYNQARQSVKNFIQARFLNEIIFTKGTTDSINLIAQSFGKAFIEEDDEIIISEMEHHSNIVPWQILCKEKKAVLKILPIDENAEIQMDQFEKMLSPKTKLVAVAHIANSTGTINPIEEIIKKAHKKNVKVLIDGAQSAAHLPINVQKLDADFFVFSGHKIYGPTGIGILYGKEELLKKMPPVQGGGDMIKTVTLHHSFYKDPPEKFEAGTPAIAEVIALKKTVDFLEKIDRKKIHEYETEITDYALEKMQKIPNLKIIGNPQKRGSIISFIIQGKKVSDIAKALDKKNIALRTGCHCAQPTMNKFNIKGTARISFGIYNTKEEIDLFINALKNL